MEYIAGVMIIAVFVALPVVLAMCVIWPLLNKIFEVITDGDHRKLFVDDCYQYMHIKFFGKTFIKYKGDHMGCFIVGTGFFMFMYGIIVSKMIEKNDLVGTFFFNQVSDFLGSTLLFIATGFAIVYGSRALYRTTKKLGQLKDNLAKHMKDTNAHKGEV